MQALKITEQQSKKANEELAGIVRNNTNQLKTTWRIKQKRTERLSRKLKGNLATRGSLVSAIARIAKGIARWIEKLTSTRDYTP